MFLVEFIGGGLSSRTVFQKGQLFLVQSCSLTGHLIRVYNQSGPISNRLTRLGLYLDNEFISANKEGLIAIPFQERTSDKQVVVVHDDLAQRHTVHLKNESYIFKSNLMYNNESLVENNVATCIL